MAFMRRTRRHKVAEGTAQALAQPVRPSPPELFVRAGGGDAASNASSSAALEEGQAGLANRLPPGMGALPAQPPGYVRQLERRAPSIDGSTDGRSRHRLRALFKRHRAASVASNTVEKHSATADHERDAPSEQTPPYPDDSAEYEGHVFRSEAPQTRLQLCDLKSKGRYVRVADEVCEVVRVHDNYVSFVVPHGWRATRTPWGFYLSSKLSIGFVMACGAKDASRLLVDTQRLSVFSEVRVMASPVFESRHTAVVHYAAHDISGRGVALFDIGFFPGAVVFALCAPQADLPNLGKIEERLAASAVVLNVPEKNLETGTKAMMPNGMYEPTTRLSSGTNCVMQ